MKPQLQGTIFQITKFQTNSKVITGFVYIRHYGPVILLLCMMTSKTGLWEVILSDQLNLILLASRLAHSDSRYKTTISLFIEGFREIPVQSDGKLS